MDVLYRCQFCKNTYENIEEASNCEAQVKELREKYPNGTACSVVVKEKEEYVRILGNLQDLEFGPNHNLKGVWRVYNNSDVTVGQVYIKPEYLAIGVATAQLMLKNNIERLP